MINLINPIQPHQHKPMLHVSVSHILPIVAAWHFIEREIAKSKNMTDVLHSIIFMLHYSCQYDLAYAIHLSIGFYLYDTLHLLKSGSMEKSAKYIVHHVLAIYVLNTSLAVPRHAADAILHGYNILEMSNLGLYLNKHVVKAHGDKPSLLLLSRLVEFLWYASFRVLKLTPYMIEISGDARALGMEIWFMLFMIYGMGLVWSHKLFMINARNYADLKKLVMP